MSSRTHYDINGQPYRIKAVKPGPKPLPEFRKHIVPIRMNQFEKEMTRRKAKARGMSLSEYIRSLVYADCVYTESSE